MNARVKRFSIRALIILVVVFITVPVLAQLGILPFGPSDAELAELDERWAVLFEHAPPATGTPNQALAKLSARYDELKLETPKGELEFASLAAPERQLIEDFRTFVATTPLARFGRRDALPLIKLSRFTLALRPPAELPIAKLLDATDQMLSRGDLLDALLSFGLATRLLEAAAIRGLSQQDLAQARRPTSEDLVRAILTDLNTNWKEADLQFTELSEGASPTLRDNAREFQVYGVRKAIAEFGERVWKARDDLDRLIEQDPIAPPGEIELYIQTVLGIPAAWSVRMHSMIEKSMARNIHQWRSLQSDWDLAVAALPSADED